MSLKTVLISTLAFVGLSQNVNAQVPDWSWAVGGTANVGASITSDGLGNVLVAGSFQSNTLVLGTTTLANMGSSDIVLAKYNFSGDILWAKSFGGSKSDQAGSVSCDDSGNVVVTGSFSSTTITFGTTTLTNNVGRANIFIAKYDPSGNILWAKSADKFYGNSISEVGGSSISFDPLGNIAVTGSFSCDSITFGTTTLTLPLGSGGQPNIFVVKCDRSGNVLWAKGEGGAYSDLGRSVSFDAIGNILVTGTFTGSGPYGLQNPNIGGAFSAFYVLKYNPNGTYLWGKSGSASAANDRGTGVYADPFGNVLAIGTFEGPSIDLGGGYVQPIGSSDGFIVKYDSIGNFRWAKNTQGYAQSISGDPSGNVLVAGFFKDSVNFGATTLRNGGGVGIFIAKYDTSGSVLWAKAAGGDTKSKADGVNSVASDNWGNVLITGRFQSPTITFGTTTLTNNYESFFVAKIGSFGTGIHDVRASDLINVYPNPASNQLFIELNDFKNTKVEIFNIEGKLLQRTTLISSKTTLEISNLTSGIYFVKIKSDKGVVMKKVIKE